MHFLQRLLRWVFNATIGPVLALILIFEEWGWEPLARFFALLARLPLWAKLERFIAQLPPYWALVAFFTPGLLLLPVKLLALYWIGKGHAVWGVALVVLAKLTGTAAVARLFALTQPALMQLAWFARLYGRWKPWKDALIARVKDTPIWRSTAAYARTARDSIRTWLKSLF